MLITPPNTDEHEEECVSPVRVPVAVSPLSPEADTEQPDAKAAWKKLLGQAPSTPLKKTARRVSKPFKTKSKGMEQLIIEVTNAKQSAPIQCPDCRMTYFRGQQSDERAHDRHHRRFLAGVRLSPSLVAAHTVARLQDGECVVRVNSNSPALLKTRALEVVDMVDEDLGAAFQDRATLFSRCQIFLSVAEQDHAVLACVVAEIVSPDRIISSPSSSLPSSYCGVNRMWARASHRRRGITTRLLDCTLVSLAFGHRFARSDVAFSQPTTLGRLFSEKYIGISNVPVYNACP